jgi:hypothetical protein
MINAKTTSGKYNAAKVETGLTLLGTTEQRSVVFETEVNVDQLGPGEELHDHARGDDRGDTEFHQGTPVGGEDGSEPVERVRRV